MDQMKLVGLEPQVVWDFFEGLCEIPHGSGNTKAISDHLVGFAKSRRIPYIQDELNNVLMFKPGTPGYEDHPPVILQGHMDMVCDKEDGCPIDMATQGLDVTHDEEWVFAKGTTLGGDNGIAVAYAMALLEDRNIPHPPLEILLTVDEETGMDGATGVDLSVFKGRTLINLDSEEEGWFTVACAGGARATISKAYPRKAVYGPCVKLTVEGLQGGHSGVEIDRNRTNANKVMGTLLSRIREKMPICLTKLSGGAKDNAIPRSCQATLVPMGTDLEPLNDIIAQLQQEIRSTYEEPDAVIRGENVDALGGNALSTEDTAQIIDLLCQAPNGVQSWSQDIPGLVQTSLNLGILELGQELRATFSVRSSVEAEKEDVLAQLRALAEAYGCDYSEGSRYPAWEYRKDSPLRDTMVRIYKELFRKEPKVVAIHAGLECGLLGEKLPGLDCVSIGPDMLDIHTSRERLNIASTKRTWEFLLEVLKNL